MSESVEVYGSINSFLWGVNTHSAMTFNFGVNVGAQLWGGSGLGMWEDHDDADSDMDDWLLEELEDDGDGEDENQGEEKDKNENQKE